MSRILIAGCGFLGEAAAVFFHRNGHDVLALTASDDSARRRAQLGFPVIAADLSSEKSLQSIRADQGTFDLVVHCASSGRGDAASYQRVFVEGAAQLARVFSENHLVFTSSTSVYAQTSGEWVDEDSPAEPARETGRMLRRAETVVLERGGCVLRLAGLYGPGRSALLQKFLDGRAVLEVGGNRWLNQIHRDDAVRALAKVATSGTSGIFNVADDTPARQSEVYSWIAEFLGRPLPPEGPADPHRKRGWTSKRIANRRLRDLGWEPEFPSYRAALPSVAASLGVAAGAGEGTS